MMRILGVGELGQYLRASLDADPILQDSWIAGEVSNLGRPSSGHVYFTLKDSGGQIRCALFRSNAGRNPRFSDGDAVIVHGRVSFYEASGQIQLYVDIVQPEGVGRLHLEFLALKMRLDDEGLFEIARKRPIPRFPKRIAIITSPTGAVLHDICTVVERRYPRVEIVVAPTLVQGAEAAASICRAFAQVAQLRPLPDTVIVARGGGSLEDLWPFNEEAVARAIFACPVPVISGVGHETDVTIADMVADLRAPTPSVAAELVVPDRLELQALLERTESRLQNAVWAVYDDQRDHLTELIEGLLNVGPQIDGAAGRVAGLSTRLQTAVANRLERANERYRGAVLTLQALSPLLTLARGFAAITSETGRAVTSVEQVQPRELVSVRLHDGAFTSEVRARCP